MLKNTFSLVFMLLLAVSLFAQKDSAIKKASERSREITVKTEKLKQFKEKSQSFEKSLKSGQQKDIRALKLMMEQTMLTEIRQQSRGVRPVSTNVARKQSGTSKSRIPQTQPAPAKNDKIRRLYPIYKEFVAIDELDNTSINQLERLTNDFYKSMESDLIKTKAAHDDIN